MADRPLTTRELNRALLARQLLLERADLAPDRALAAVCGLQTQHAPSGYLGLWSRTVGFHGAELWVDLLRVPPAGTWNRPRATVFALAEHVVPGASPDPGDPHGGAPHEDAARDLLLVRYLRAFGPASAGDAASLTGLPPAVVRPAARRAPGARRRGGASHGLSPPPRRLTSRGHLLRAAGRSRTPP